MWVATRPSEGPEHGRMAMSLVTPEANQLPPAARYGPIIPVARPAHPRPLSGTSRMMGPSTPASASQWVGQPTSVSWVVSFEDNYALCWSFSKFIMPCFGLFWFKNPFLPCWMWHLNKMFREVGAVKMYPVDDYWTCRVLGSMDDDDVDVDNDDDMGIGIWVCLKMGYTPNYSHLVGRMIINHWV